ncbi:MAG TPA: hypothetical protein DEB05_02140 [Firmicutes bacterium]|nr:hypothetical protein [Bacillota bacterium]
MDKRIIGISLFFLLTGLFSGGSLLTRAVERNIKNSLKQQAQVEENLEFKLAPMSISDFFKGQVREFSFSAVRLGFPEGPVFQELSLQSKGMRFDAGALLFKGKLEIRELKETFLSLKIPENELTAMIRKDLPEIEPTIFLEEGQVELKGSLDLLGQGRLPFSATAYLEKASDQSLRLTPIGLKVGGVPLLSGLFKRYVSKITWEFPLEMPWPVRLDTFQIKPGVIKMEWREEREGGKG